MHCDRRPDGTRPTPAHALTAAERAKVLRAANEPRFAGVPPARIVPTLTDEAVYLAGESTFHRVLREHGQTRHRGRGGVLTLDDADPTPDTRVLVAQHAFFRLDAGQAAGVVEDIRNAIRPWAGEAKASGANHQDLSLLGAVINPER